MFLSVVYLFSSSIYLCSAQHFISNVNSVEGINRCVFAQRGVLLHGDITCGGVAGERATFFASVCAVNRLGKSWLLNRCTVRRIPSRYRPRFFHL